MNMGVRGRQQYPDRGLVPNKELFGHFKKFGDGPGFHDVQGYALRRGSGCLTIWVHLNLSWTPKMRQ
jgi:hypothetical protein